MLLHQRFKFTWWPNPCDTVASKIQMYNTITWTIEQDSLNLNVANTLLVFTLFEKDKILINLLLMWSLLLFWLHFPLHKSAVTNINCKTFQFKCSVTYIPNLKVEHLASNLHRCEISWNSVALLHGAKVCEYEHNSNQTERLKVQQTLLPKDTFK